MPGASAPRSAPGAPHRVAIDVERVEHEFQCPRLGQRRQRRLAGGGRAVGIERQVRQRAGAAQGAAAAAAPQAPWRYEDQQARGGTRRCRTRRCTVAAHGRLAMSFMVRVPKARRRRPAHRRRCAVPAPAWCWPPGPAAPCRER